MKKEFDKKQLEEQLIDIIDKMPTGKDSDLIIYKGKMMTVLKFRKRLLNDKRKS